MAVRTARLFALALALCAPAAAASPKPPEPEAPIHRGAELVATRDVELYSAHIAKGSRVIVVDVQFANGKPSSVSLELKDGHVLADVPYDRIATSFRLAKG